MEVGPELTRDYSYFLMSFEPDHTEDTTSPLDYRNPMGQNLTTLQNNHPIGWQFFTEANVQWLQSRCEGAQSYFQLEPIMKKIYMGRGVKWEMSVNKPVIATADAVQALNDEVIHSWEQTH